MESKVKILIYIDQRRRDLHPMRKIGDALKREGRYHVKLSGKVDFLFTVMHFKPHIIIFGKNDGYHGDWLRAISDCVVISINTEQGYCEPNETYINFMEGHKYDRPPAHDRVDYHFLVSELTKRHLAPHIDERKLKVVGYTRLLQDQFAVRARQTREQFVVGIACGEDIGDREKIQAHFSRYLEKPFGYLDNVQGFLAFHLLDRCWINLLAQTLKNKYRVIVRYRFGDKDYLLDEDGLEIDMSSAPGYFFEKCDLVIMGQSTIGIEAMMFGVPVISTVKMIDPGFSFDKVSCFPYIQVCWQPENLNELLSMIELRRQGRLELSPRLDEYSKLVSNTYYNGAEKDNCMKNICNFIAEMEIKGEARLDLPKLFSLLKYSGRWKTALQLSNRYANKLTYNFLISYLQIRSKLKKTNFQEVYIPKLIEK